MGCCSSRKETDSKVEETIIMPFEQRLGLSRYNYRDLTSQITNSDTAYVSYQTLKSVFRSLSLPLQEFSEFYSVFERTHSEALKGQKFSYLKLNSLFLLLSNDDLKIKLKYWVWLYEPNNKCLSKAKINEMLENLVKVSVDYISGHLCLSDKSNAELVNYQKLIKTGKHFVIEELSRKVRGDKTIIEVEEFFNNCMKFCGRGLFTPVYLRDKSYLYGVRCQQHNNDKKLEKVKKKMPLLFQESDSTPPLQPRKHMHKKTNSTVNETKIPLFPLDSTKNLKENFRYADSLSTSPKHKEEQIRVKNYREDFYTDRDNIIKNFPAPGKESTLFEVHVCDSLDDENSECGSAVFRPSLELGAESERLQKRGKVFKFGGETS